MRNFIKFLLMLPMVVGSMILAAMLVGLSVAVDSLDDGKKSAEVPAKRLVK